MKIKIFTHTNPSQLEKEVNEFLHPMVGARIGRMHYSTFNQGMVNVHSCMVQYMELDGTEGDEPIVQIG